MQSCKISELFENALTASLIGIGDVLVLSHNSPKWRNVPTGPTMKNIAKRMQKKVKFLQIPLGIFLNLC